VIGMPRLPRRTFFRALIIWLGTFLLMPHRQLAAGTKQADRTRLAEAITGAFELDSHAMQSIGEAAIRSGCAEQASTLGDYIVDWPGVTVQEFLYASPAERRHLITSAIRNDFTTGRYVEVDGWILAATEVRICLMALS